MPQSETTNNVIKGWLRFKKYLSLDEHQLVLPGSLTLRQLQALMERYRSRKPYNDRVIHPLLKRLGIRVLANLTDGLGNWINTVPKLRTNGVQLQQVQWEAMEVFQQWLNTVKIGTQKLKLSPSWRWRTEETQWKGWLRPSKFWHKLNKMEETLEDLSSKWPVGTYQLTWHCRWKHLWEGAGPPRIKLWIWRLLRRACFIGEHAATMQVAFDPCSRCNDDVETIPHLFYGCRDSMIRWNKLRELTTNGCTSFCIPHGLLELIDEAIVTQRKGGPLIFILYSVTNSIWQDRNQVLYNQKSQRTPLQLSLEQARAEIEGSFSNRQSSTRWEQVNDLLKRLAEAS
ncbi:hypothetical protein R1flu_020792 [Riccia fluitans]|uniref:Reverse transcriptase zinc-binding domain-containing protein n=1 Tax=Riccia fluitans TaxID=41844 RepID=A0ABD1ZMI8_9MARC